jgi:hypothetical protein
MRQLDPKPVDPRGDPEGQFTEGLVVRATDLAPQDKVGLATLGKGDARGKQENKKAQPERRQAS